MLGTEQEAPLYEVCPRGIDHGVVGRGSCPWLVITRCEQWADRDSQRAQVARGLSDQRGLGKSGGRHTGGVT